MKIPLDQLPLHLKNNLLPVYFISGDELLLVQEARDHIRHAANQNGYLERSCYEVTKEFDWQNFLLSTQSKSLFSDKAFIELRLPEKINTKCSQALMTYLENPSPNHLLLLMINKCDQSLQRSDWYQKILKIGAHTPIWGLDAKQFAVWIQKKLQTANLKLDLQGIQILIELTENNLLAATQEIQKLKMLYGEGKISSVQVLNAVSDYSKFDIFALGDCLLKGDQKKVIRIVSHLKQEATEPTLVLWTINRNLRTLVNLKYLIAFGKDLDILFKELKIWPKRQPLFKNALKRHSLKELYLILLHAQHIDSMIKGICLGNIWEEVLRLSLKIVATSV